MKLTAALASLLVTAGIASACPLPAAPAEPPLRVGTIDSESLVIAYYRSDVSAKVIADLKAQEKDAKARGDKAKVKALNTEGERIQELAHQQMEGKAPVDSIVANIKPQLAEVAAKSHVDVIIEGKVYASARPVEMVDVTEPVLESLKADAATRKVIAELKAKHKK